MLELCTYDVRDPPFLRVSNQLIDRDLRIELYEDMDLEVLMGRAYGGNGGARMKNNSGSENRGGGGHDPSDVWDCNNCKTVNFSSRGSCQFCDLRRPDNHYNYNDNNYNNNNSNNRNCSTAPPSSVLLMRGIHLSSTPTTLAAAIQTKFNTSLPRVTIIFNKHTNAPTGICYVDFKSVAEACKVKGSFGEGEDEVDGSFVRVEFSLEGEENENFGFENQNRQVLEFPPPFESDSGSYDFDPVSGFFYEPMSQFYYDAKTKLYYANSKYFTFDPMAEPQFREVVSELPKVVAETTTNGGGGGGGEKKRKIKISLGGGGQNPKKKKKASKEKEKEKEKTLTPAATTTAIEKWTVKQQELTEDEPQKPKQKQNENEKDCTSFICYLCKRKFVSGEKLLKHEKKSKMHADNLLQTGSHINEYRDRNSERKKIHREEPTAKAKAKTKAQPKNQTPVGTLEDENNVGRKMFNKLAGPTYIKPKENEHHEHLKKAWAESET